MIEFHKVTLSKDPVWSREPFDLSIPDGETVVLFGPEGCGKESLLRILAGLDKPGSGLVRIVSDGLELSLPQLKRHASFLVRRDPLMGPLTVRDTLFLHCLLKGNGKTQADLMCDEAIETFALQKAAFLRADSLPTDWKRYVALVCVLMQRGFLFLLDEPFEGLSPTHCQRVLDLLRAGKGRQTLIVSVSDPVNAEWLGGRLILMKNSLPFFDGTCLSAVLTANAHSFPEACDLLYRGQK